MRVINQIVSAGLLFGFLGGVFAAPAQDLPTLKTTFRLDTANHQSWAGTRQGDGVRFRMDVYLSKSPEEAQRVTRNLTAGQRVGGADELVRVSTITGRKLGDGYWTSAKSAADMKGTVSVVVRLGTTAYRASIINVERKGRGYPVLKPITKTDIGILEDLISGAMNDPRNPFPDRNPS